MRKMISTAISLAVLSTSPAYAAACRDEKGKFIKCYRYEGDEDDALQGRSGQVREARHGWRQPRVSR